LKEVENAGREARRRRNYEKAEEGNQV